MPKKINALTSRDAVIAAIKECDELGRDNFLAQYGYERARKYPLVYKKREYDSKAIAGVAYGKQFGTPLTPRELDGGVTGAVPPLLKLGFKIRGLKGPNADGPANEESTKNPKWNRDELMLALHLYLHNRKSPPSQTSTQVAELSELLGNMSKHSTASKTFRNPTGVYMKMMNFRSLDPQFTTEGKKRLTRRNSDELIVWTLYADRLDYLDKLVASIKAAVDYDIEDTGISDEDEIDIEDCEEGRVLTRMHRDLIGIL